MYEEIGQELKRLRIKSGLKQKDVAKELGYSSAQFVSNWERGVSTPPVKSVKKLASLYKASPEKLFKKLQNAVIKSMREEYEKTGTYE